MKHGISLTILLLLLSGLVNACKDSNPGAPAVPPSFDDLFYKRYSNMGPVRVIPKGIPLDSVSFPQRSYDSSWLVLRKNHTYSLMSKFFITINQGSTIDTLSYRIAEEGSLELKSYTYYYGLGGIGWTGTVRFLPSNKVAWECKYDLKDNTTSWPLWLWGPILLPDSSDITVLIATP